MFPCVSSIQLNVHMISLNQTDQFEVRNHNFQTRILEFDPGLMEFPQQKYEV